MLYESRGWQYTRCPPFPCIPLSLLTSRSIPEVLFMAPCLDLHFYRYATINWACPPSGQACSYSHQRNAYFSAWFRGSAFIFVTFNSIIPTHSALVKRRKKLGCSTADGDHLLSHGQRPILRHSCRAKGSLYLFGTHS
ncbi:hypothetical protein K469DRAFT_264290 [Zopfia rhizophila CBS 207.26]|uniref:Uncharacterized protein n=1 Tax=Zopfia rhizophila CBS 207.26 TaxID=1314779 RepID=A0A6A6DS53_9PEZI|nr:hypothetical protein K469DRAFT_264290 [Zopfia rhizophila CBS 207.26]